MIADVPSGHPADFSFDLGYRLECGACGRRAEVSAETYFHRHRAGQPGFECDCNHAETAEIEVGLRDPDDTDRDDEQVDRHLWYHSSPYHDWPSPHYRDDLAARLQRLEMSRSELTSMIDTNASKALHLGTYAAAIENTLRRMDDEDTAPGRYWLHQVQIHLEGTDLAPGVHRELSDFTGRVPLHKLEALGARAARYVNVHEAPGSISLAIHPNVIVRVRTIPLPGAPVPATAAGDRAVERALAELSAARQLRPDTTGLSEGQYFESELDLLRAEMGGRTVSAEVIARTKQLAPQFQRAHDREYAIESALRDTLTDLYLPAVTPQLRERILDAIPATEPAEFHQRLREQAGPIAAPQLLVEQFQSAAWRTPASAIGSMLGRTRTN